MPRIEVVTARDTAVVTQPSSLIPVTGDQGLGQLGNFVGDFGTQLQKIGEKLQAHQNELDVAEITGKFAGIIKELEINVQRDVADPMARAKEFEKRARQAQEELLATTKNRNVARGFEAYVGKHLPIHTANVHGTALDYMGQQQTAQMQDVLHALSQNAARALDAPERQSWINAGVEIITNNPHDPPIKKQERRQAFIKKTQSDWARILMNDNIDKLFEEEKKGSFSDMDARDLSDLMVRAETQRAAKIKVGQAALDKAYDTHREGVEMFMIDKIVNKTLTQSDINDWKPDFVRTARGSEKIMSWQTALENQSLGVVGGDPDQMRQFQSDVYDLDVNPRKTLDRLIAVNKKVGVIDARKFPIWANHLAVRIKEGRDEGKSDADKFDVRKREWERTRASDAIEMATLRFPFTGNRDFDKDANELLARFREMVATEGRSRGGQVDEMELYKTRMPDLLAQMGDRLSTAKRQREDFLGKHRDKKSLLNARDTMSEDEFERKVRALEELQALRKSEERLAQSKKEIGR
jgi:hypothetical protein